MTEPTRPPVVVDSPPWDPFNGLLAPAVDQQRIAAFPSPDGQPGIVGVTIYHSNGELTMMMTKAKAARFAHDLLAALDQIPDPSGLIVPSPAAGQAFMRATPPPGSGPR